MDVILGLAFLVAVLAVIDAVLVVITVAAVAAFALIMRLFGLHISIVGKKFVLVVTALWAVLLMLVGLSLPFVGGRATPPPPEGEPTPIAAAPPTAVPVFTPGPVPTLDPDEIVKQQLEKLTLGQIAFNPPTSVSMGVVTPIQARIARSIDQPSLTEGMLGPGVPQVQTIRVSTFMGAELTGENFDIKALDSATQVVEDAQATQWEWEVKATRPGKQTLHLRVWARVVAPPLPEQPKDLGVLDRDVDVQVNPTYSVTQFWEANWQWILGTPTVIGGAILSIQQFLKRVLKRSEKRRAQVRPLH